MTVSRTTQYAPPGWAADALVAVACLACDRYQLTEGSTIDERNAAAQLLRLGHNAARQHLMNTTIIFGEENLSAAKQQTPDMIEGSLDIPLSSPRTSRVEVG